MAAVARTNTKAVTADNVRSIATTDNSAYKKNKSRKSVGGSDYKKSPVSYKASSIAANANLLLRNMEDDHDEEEKKDIVNDVDKAIENVDKVEFNDTEISSSDNAKENDKQD